MPGIPATETCDGAEDEGCACTNGQVRGCCAGPAGTSGVGACAAGMQTCSDGAWGSCVNEVLPSTEACDGGLACNTGLAGICANGTTSGTNGALACIQDDQASTEA